MALLSSADKIALAAGAAAEILAAGVDLDPVAVAESPVIEDASVLVVGDVTVGTVCTLPATGRRAVVYRRSEFSEVEVATLAVPSTDDVEDWDTLTSAASRVSLVVVPDPVDPGVQWWTYASPYSGFRGVAGRVVPDLTP